MKCQPYGRLRWGGLCCTILLLAAWGYTFFAGVLLIVRPGWSMSMGHGGVYLLRWGDSTHEFNRRLWHEGGHVRWLPDRADESAARWADWWFMPLWMPLIVVAAPTVFFWIRSRQLVPGQCHRCGYDLTGNVSGVCPECGAAL